MSKAIPGSINSEPFLERTKEGHVFVGTDVDVFGITALAMGLRLYAKTGMKPNRAYTPTNMLKMASLYTKKKYKRGQFEEAAADLLAHAQELKGLPRLT